MIQKMSPKILLVLFLPTIISQSAFNSQKFNEAVKSKALPSRLLQLMKSYYDDATKRIAEMTPMRFVYEVSPQYEQGYVMGEIIERYRKVVEHVIRTTQIRYETIYPTLDRVEVVQKQYLEMYHLVNMMHETSRKYTSDPKYMHQQMMKTNDTYVMEAIKEAEEAEKRRIKQEKERKKWLKRERKRERQESAIGKLVVPTYKRKKDPYNKFWQIDYGWEVDEKWK